MIKIESRVLGPVGTNCYLIINKENNESIIIDPADSPEFDGQSECGYLSRCCFYSQSGPQTAARDDSESDVSDQTVRRHTQSS